MQCFYSFSEVFGRNFKGKQRVIKFLRRLKEAHLRFLDLKNLKLLGKEGMRVNNCKFAKDNSIRATFLSSVKFNNV